MRSKAAALIILLSSITASAIYSQVSPPDVNAVEKITNKKEAKPSKFYAKIYGGYGLGTQTSYKARNYSIVRTTTDATSINVDQNTAYKKGFGTGYRVGIGFGFVANDFINLGVDAEYHNFSDRTLSDVITTIYSNGKRRVENTDYIFNGNMVRVTPSIMIKANFNPRFQLYTKLGLSLAPLFNLDYPINQTIIDSANASTFAETKREFTFAMPIGFDGSLGFQIRLNDKLRFFSEANFYHMSAKIKKLEIVSYTVNGTDVLSTLPIRNKITEYVDSDTDPDSPTNPGIPLKQVAYKIPFTAIGLSLGVVYRF
jgi:hypothetical protein